MLNVLLQGFPGSKGDRGELGLPGSLGINGSQGQQGDSGIPGMKGLRGEPGVQGTKGNDSRKFADGCECLSKGKLNQKRVF